MRFLRFLLGTLAAAAIVLAAADIATARLFPHLSRLGPDFSSAYLSRVAREDRSNSKILVLGDSVLWGYRLTPDQSAASILARAGWPIENLSYEGGSAPNTYALLRFLLSNGVRPRAVIFNVNLKEFNVNDSAYQKLHPAVEALAWPLLSDADRKSLIATSPQTLDARIDRALAGVWFLYGARSDIRDYLFRDKSDAATFVRDAVEAISGTAARDAVLHQPTADKFIGTYDLTELSSSNVGVHFLEELADLLHENSIPAFAILTPTNHTLLHDYIDGPEYAAQLTYVTRLLQSRGIGVLNYDRSFGTGSFIDNDHLTAPANRQLAAAIARDVRL
jgi:hypothetical protein